MGMGIQQDCSTHEGKTLRDLLHLAKMIISSIYANTRGTLTLRNELLFLSLNICLTSFKRPGGWTLNLPAMEDWIQLKDAVWVLHTRGSLRRGTLTDTAMKTTLSTVLLLLLCYTPDPYCNLMAKCRKLVFRSLKLQETKRQTRMRNRETLTTVQGSQEGAVWAYVQRVTEIVG